MVICALCRKRTEYVCASYEISHDLYVTGWCRFFDPGPFDVCPDCSKLEQNQLRERHRREQFEMIKQLMPLIRSGDYLCVAHVRQAEGNRCSCAMCEVERMLGIDRVRQVPSGTEE